MPRMRPDPRPGLKTLRLYTDACARGNPGPAACGILLVDRAGREVDRSGKVLGAMTNNEAEYRGLLFGLERAAAAGAERLEVTMDSELVVRQMRGAYKVKAPRLRALALEVRRREAAFPGGVAYRHAPRATAEMEVVDAIANETLDAGAP